MAKMIDDDYTPVSGGKNGPTWESFTRKYKMKKGWNKLRIYGLLYSDARHNNIKTKTGKAYAEFCSGYDVENDKFFADREEKCECCKLGFPTSLRYFVAAFSVDDWENRPAVPPAEWSPFYTLEMSPNLYEKILELRDDPNSNGVHVGHPTKGSIIGIKYAPDAIPANQYTVSLITVGWVFPEEVKALTITQNTPEGKRVLLKGAGNLPPALVYYPVRNTREKVVQSLTTHGHYGEVKGDTHPDVESKGNALLQELNGFNGFSDERQPSVSGVKEIAKLHKTAQAPVHVPADPVDIEDSIPF